MNFIKGIIIQVIYRNEMNGYTVGLVRIKETDADIKTSTFHFVGTFGEIKLKSTYIFKGKMIRHNKYGKQFEVDTYEIDIPTKNDELVDFLSSDLFPIGEKTAMKIVELFKEKTIDTILNSPENLLLVPRLSKDRINKIHDVILEYQNTNHIVLELAKLGFDTKEALGILKKYNTKSLDVVNKNIYSLIGDNDLRFSDVDEIALNMGIDKDDERRVKALVIYLINAITFNNGDTYLYIEELHEGITKRISGYDINSLEYILHKLNKDNLVILEDNRIYLKEFYDAEINIVDRICYLNELNIRKLPKLKEKIEHLEELNAIKYDDSQKKAIATSLNNNITIITGGPGTGKTTIVKAIVSLLKDIYSVKNNEIALLSPTGRASKRLMEATLVSSSTIHRYLGWDKETNKFSVDEYSPNKEKYIIVDEASMIDTMLLSALFKGTIKDAKYIFVGDYYQLPSVSQGQVLKDLIDSDMITVIRLNCLYRQNANSYIVDLAKEIRNKDLSENFNEKKDDYNFIECPNDYVLEIMENIVDKAISKGYDKSDIQVLAPMYKSLNGIDNLNKKLQEIINPMDPFKNELVFGDVIYREGDKVIQLVNENDNNVYNGDLGYITSIVTKNKNQSDQIIIDFDGNKVTYSRDKFINFTHGYAISIHKSQGGEYKMVIIPFVNSFKRMLYNKLVYTAVTRAKKTLILVGDKTSFIYGVNNDYIDNRKTTIKKFLIDRYNK